MMSMLFFPSYTRFLKIMLLFNSRTGGGTISRNHLAFTVATAWALRVFQTPWAHRN